MWDTNKIQDDNKFPSEVNKDTSILKTPTELGQKININTIDYQFLGIIETTRCIFARVMNMRSWEESFLIVENGVLKDFTNWTSLLSVSNFSYDWWRVEIKKGSGEFYPHASGNVSIELKRKLADKN